MVPLHQGGGLPKAQLPQPGGAQGAVPRLRAGHIVQQRRAAKKRPVQGKRQGLRQAKGLCRHGPGMGGDPLPGIGGGQQLFRQLRRQRQTRQRGGRLQVQLPVIAQPGDRGVRGPERTALLQGQPHRRGQQRLDHRGVGGQHQIAAALLRAGAGRGHHPPLYLLQRLRPRRDQQRIIGTGGVKRWPALPDLPEVQPVPDAHVLLGQLVHQAQGLSQGRRRVPAAAQRAGKYILRGLGTKGLSQQTGLHPAQGTQGQVRSPQTHMGAQGKIRVTVADQINPFHQNRSSKKLS